MTTTSDAVDTAHTYDFAIIGTGFGGLCAAIKLMAQGERDFVLLERADSVGGTWRDNSYPGCACDVASILYSFSFEQNPDWSRTFPSQPELWDYLKRVADKYGVTPYIRFKHPVTMTEYDPAANLWRLQTPHGTVSARFVISAAGGLSEPARPDIPGLDTFKGALFHSAQWDHAHELDGERVAVIGTGASSIQIIPAIAPIAARVDVYQRTAAWVAPRLDRVVKPRQKALRRTPLKWVLRSLVYLRGEASALFFTRYPAGMRLLQALLLNHLKRRVKDPVLREKLTPTYTVGCKRVLISDDFYPAMQRENVHLITDGIREITERGVVTVDGTEREVDTIVLCTGFHATDNPMTTRVRGRDGRTLAEHWAETGEEAYLGTLVHGFPNYFFITGPNTGIGHTSLVFMIESQVHFIMKCIREHRAGRLKNVEIRRDVQDAFNVRMQEHMKSTVWASGGCKSWYQNSRGKVTTLWPQLTFVFWWKLRRLRLGDFEQGQ